MTKNLVIVESPAKAKTIEGFLGKDYTVKSSFGHIRDLAKNDKAIDIKNNFLPHYEISEDKKSIVSELKKLSKGAEITWLATDEDREGEAISWHLFEALGLDENKTKRIAFHEITKVAIDKAIQNPRKIDKHLVDAQQARRVLDRLVGFELSPILWKKIKPSLSAGRVQSVAVRLIVEREREIDHFITGFSYKVVASFEVGNNTLMKAELPHRFKTDVEARDFLSKCIGAKFTIKDLEIKPSKKSPAAPFTTSTLQQEASRKLGYSVAQTMVVAQHLYESGKITYMRTDSVNLSETAMAAAKAEITSHYGANFSEPRQYKTKSAGAQEAHEAIRPTYMDLHSIEGDSSEKRLYDLIWKRTLASQMADAKIEKTIATISISTTKENFVANGEVLKFEGFLKVYMESSDDENEEKQDGMLPPLNVNQEIFLNDASAIQRFTHAAARYTEASLVKKLEELGIGRPSTYAPTISTIQKRGYVVKEDREGKERNYKLITLVKSQINEEIKVENTGAEKSKLFPSDIGIVVNDFLVENFKKILDYHFTAKVEKEFDEIAEGQMQWNQMIKAFYEPFHKDVELTLENSERATGERPLGVDPVSGKPVIARIGRYGPVVQMGTTENDAKPQFASLKPSQRIENLTLEDALELFKLPRNIGEFEGYDMTAALGRFGPYIKHNNNFFSLKKEDNPLTIVSDRAIELILEKRKVESERLIKSFPENPEVLVLNGRWGPYIAVGKKNVKIPKGVEPLDLTLETCLKLAADAPESKSRFAKKKAVVADKGKPEAPKKAKVAPSKKAVSKKKAAPKRKKQ
jgi:DNA topoisomerase-1